MDQTAVEAALELWWEQLAIYRFDVVNQARSGGVRLSLLVVAVEEPAGTKLFAGIHANGPEWTSFPRMQTHLQQLIGLGCKARGRTMQDGMRVGATLCHDLRGAPSIAFETRPETHS